MCLLLFFINPYARDEDFYLILLSIRDEMYNRPSLMAHFWDKHPDVFGGIDCHPDRRGGAWFAISKTGKIGALLNVLQPDDEIVPDKKGRGFLVTDYVTGNEDCYEYLNKVSSEKDNYNGFTLVTMDIGKKKDPKVAYFSNISSSTPEIIDPTILEYHAFGNSISVEDPWPKVKKAKERFQTIVNCNRKASKKDRLIADLLSLAGDQDRYGMDENMKMQGRSKPPEFLHNLTSTYVHMPDFNYGSRSQAIVLVEGSGKVHYTEKHRRTDRVSSWKISNHTFQVNFNYEGLYP